MNNITAVNTFTDPVTVLADGDAVASANTIPTIQALTNRSLFNASGLRVTPVVSAAGTTVLTATSTRGQVLTGTSAQTFQLPDETTLNPGAVFEFFNLSTGILTIKDSGGTTLGTINTVNGSAALLSASNGAATGNWSFLRSPPGQIIGTGTNDNAASGKVGEVISANVVSTGFAPASATDMTITSVPLTPGQWDVYGKIYFNPNATASVTIMSASISNTPNLVKGYGTTDPTLGEIGAVIVQNTVVNGTGNGLYTIDLFAIEKLSASTTKYITANSTYTGAAAQVNMWGYITAIRRR